MLLLDGSQFELVLLPPSPLELSSLALCDRLWIALCESEDALHVQNIPHESLFLRKVSSLFHSKITLW